MEVKVLGAARQVGRSAFLVSHKDSKILLDYGAMTTKVPGFPMHVPPKDIKGMNKQLSGDTTDKIEVPKIENLKIEGPKVVTAHAEVSDDEKGPDAFFADPRNGFRVFNYRTVRRLAV